MLTWIYFKMLSISQLMIKLQNLAMNIARNVKTLKKEGY